MIVVEIKLSSSLREHLGNPETKPLQVELAVGATLPDLYQTLGLKPELVALSTVNNRYPEDDYRLQNGDRLRIVGHSVGG